MYCLNSLLMNVVSVLIVINKNNRKSTVEKDDEVDP